MPRPLPLKSRPTIAIEIVPPAQFKISVPLILRTRLPTTARRISMLPHQMHHRIQRQNHPHRNQRRRPPMRQQKHRRGIAIPHRQNPLPKISQPAPKQERQHKRPQRNLKNSLRQNKNLKRQRRRQNRRNKHAQKRIRIHPSPRPHRMFPSLRMKKYFPALLSQQIKPNAPSQGPNRSHSRVIRHPPRILNRFLNHQKIGNNRKRKHRRIQKRHNKQPQSTQRSHEVRQPPRQFNFRPLPNQSSPSHSQSPRFYQSTTHIQQSPRPPAHLGAISRILPGPSQFVGILGFCSELLHFGGSPRIHAGEERLSAPKTPPFLTMRFSAGHFAATASSRSIL